MALREILAAALGGLLRPLYGGRGCIVCLHRVVPAGKHSPLRENRALEITPETLRDVLAWTKARGLDPVRMDDVPARLAQPRGGKFIAFTLDDGYRDNLTHALPVFREVGVPFTVYLATDFISRRATPWWYEIGHLLESRRELLFSWEGIGRRFLLENHAQREAAFDAVAALLRAQGRAGRDALLAEIRAESGDSGRSIAEGLMMTWEEARVLAADPLVTIGAHTAGHHTLSRLDDSELAAELAAPREEIAAQLGAMPAHLSYPFGGRTAVGTREFAAAGAYTTAVTTRMANLFPAHAAHPRALPRLSLAGTYEDTIARLQNLECGIVAAREFGGRRIVTE